MIHKSLLSVILILCSVALFGQSPERPRKEVPLISNVIATIDDAEGWMLQNNGEWISAKNKIPFKNYSANKKKSGKNALGQENFDHIDLRSITIGGEIYSILLIYAQDGSYEFPVLEQNWNQFKTLTYYVFKESKWHQIFPDSTVFNQPYAVNTDLVVHGQIDEYNDDSYLFQIENSIRQALYQQAEENTNLIFACYPVQIRDKKYFRFKLYETINKREIYVKYLLPYNRDKLFRTFYYEVPFDEFAGFVDKIALIDASKLNAPGYYRHFIKLGKKKFDEQEYRTALQFFVKASMVNPPDSAMISIFLWKGKAKLQLNAGREALEDFDSAINRTPSTIKAKKDWIEAHYLRGNAYFMMHEYPDACEDWNFALQNGVDKAYEKIRKNCDRRDDGMMRPIDIEKSEKYYGRAMKKYNQEKYLRALHLFEKSWQYNYLSQDFRLPYYTGMCRYRLGDFVRSIDEFDQAAVLQPETFSKNYDTWTDVFVMRGRAWQEIGYKDNACKDWYHAKTLGNIDGESLLVIHCPDYGADSTMEINTGEAPYKQAMNSFNQGNYQKTAEILNGLSPAQDTAGIINFYSTRGNARHKTGDYQGAIRDFTRIVEMDIQNTALRQDWLYALFNRGVSEFVSGDQTGACADWKKAITLGLTDPVALEYVHMHCQD